MLQAAPSTAHPRTTPLVRVGRGTGDRVLLIGNGPVHGWGVTLRDLAVPGHLAHLIHDRTGRSVVVDYVGEERMSASSATTWLGSGARRGHDVAVVAVGMNDALRLTPPALWRRHMTELIDRVIADGDPAAQMVLVGLPHIRSYVMADSFLGSVAQRHADRLDSVLQGLADEREAVHYIPGPVEHFEPGRPIGSGPMYREWAIDLLPHVLAELQDVRRVKPPVDQEDGRLWDWDGTPVLLSADEDDPVRVRLDEIATEAQERFGVAVAGINVLDGESAYFVGGGVGAPRQLPRALAYCDTVVRDDAPLLVRDSEKDPRFRDNPFLDVVRLPFYAGVPLHSEDGRVVATLCLLDSAARSDIDPADLQRLADEAEAELRSVGSRSAVAIVPA